MDCQRRVLLRNGNFEAGPLLWSDATSFRKAVDMTDDELAAIAARAKLTVV